MQPEIHELFNSFSEIFRSLHQKSYHKTDNACIYPGHPKLLSLIKANEGITQKDLSEKTFVKPATITGTLSKLEANHYIYRIPDECDKRIMRVFLTPEGRHLAEESEKYFKRITDQLFDGITREELQILLKVTKKMKDNLQNFKK